MSTLNQPQTDVTETSELGDEAIIAYLQECPEFFERNPALLANLRLPHSTGGPAVSLVERQVSVLRQRNLQLERQLRELVDVARTNDLLTNKLHALSMQLIDTHNRGGTVNLLEQQLRTAFSADRAVLVLFGAAGGDLEEQPPFLRLMSRDDAAMRPFRTFLQARNPRCGRIRDAQREFLFGTGDVEIGSVALIPLGTKSEVGFMAIGSRDAHHFHPGKSIDFLTRLGELVAHALQR